MCVILFFFSSRRRHTRYWRDWSSDVCSSDLFGTLAGLRFETPRPEEQQSPSGLQVTDVERKREAILLRRGADRQARHEKGVERLDVVIGEPGEVVVRKRREQ